MTLCVVSSRRNRLDRALTAKAPTHDHCPPLGFTRVHSYSEFGHVSVVDYLINQLSVDVNKMLDTDGTSPGSNIGWFVFEKCPVLAEVLSGPDSTTPTRVPTMANEESDTAAYMTILDLFKSKGMLIKAPPEPSNGAQKGNTTENGSSDCVTNEFTAWHPSPTAHRPPPIAATHQSTFRRLHST